MERLNQGFLDFIGLLESHEVDYVIVGGYAVAAHGFPRYTGDIDFFIAIHEENSNKLLSVFEEFGFGGIGLTRDDFLKEDFVVEIGREPRKIQILTGIDGVTYDECLKSRLEVEYGDLKLKFIGIEELIRNKQASGRAKDIIDVQELAKIRADKG